MRYIAIAKTDTGNVREINQDSILIKHATFGIYEVLMAILCDGMGGLSKGEFASAVVIHEFDKWFERELSFELENPDSQVIAGKWSLLIKTLNIRIQEYGQSINEKIGTTFTGILFINEQYIVVHVGDTRLYYIGKSLEQLTNDQTFVAREVLCGTLSPEQAKMDKHRNMLLQCVGASKTIEPQVLYGEVEKGIYMLCSDGFYHKINETEIFKTLNFKTIKNKRIMHKKSEYLIELVKMRGERDNISIVLIKASPVKSIGEQKCFSIFQKQSFYFGFSIILFLLGILMLLYSFLVHVIF